MRVYIGGAANGKRKYVKKLLAGQKVHWHEGEIPEQGSSPVAVAGLEKWLAASGLSEKEAVEVVMNSLRNREAFVIVTDIGRGIVPMNPADRELRDRCGRLYQKLLAEAEEVTRIWYGIPEIIKQRGESNENIHAYRG